MDVTVVFDGAALPAKRETERERAKYGRHIYSCPLLLGAAPKLIVERAN